MQNVRRDFETDADGLSKLCGTKCTCTYINNNINWINIGLIFDNKPSGYKKLLAELRHKAYAKCET